MPRAAPGRPSRSWHCFDGVLWRRLHEGLGGVRCIWCRTILTLPRQRV